MTERRKVRLVALVEADQYAALKAIERADGTPMAVSLRRAIASWLDLRAAGPAGVANNFPALTRGVFLEAARAAGGTVGHTLTRGE